MKRLLFFLSSLVFAVNYIESKPITEKNRPLRILLFLNNFPTSTGGSTLSIAVGFTKQNHDITILTQNFNTASLNANHPDIIKYDLFSKVFIKKLPNNKKDFDVIICQSASLALQLLEFKKRNNITGRLIVFVRGADLKTFYNPKICKKIFESFDIIAPVCEYFKNKLSNLHKNTHKIKVFHSSIDCDKFIYRKCLLPKNKKICIATTCRLANKKGLDYAIKAIFILVKKYPKLHYIIIGDGRLRNKLQNLINTLGLDQHITLVGWKTPDEVVKLLKTCHIFILPSVTTSNGSKEGIPNSLKEAMALGIPVVSTYHAGIPELIKNGITGFLVPEKDERALAKAIEFLIEHPEIWDRIRLNARKFVENNFERDKENKKLIQECHKLSLLPN